VAVGVKLSAICKMSYQRSAHACVCMYIPKISQDTVTGVVMVIKGLGPFFDSLSPAKLQVVVKKLPYLSFERLFLLPSALDFPLALTLAFHVSGIRCVLCFSMLCCVSASARLVFHDCFPSIGFAFRLSVLLSVPQLMPGNFGPDFWHWLFWFTTASPSNGPAKRLPWPQLPLSDMSGYLHISTLYI